MWSASKAWRIPSVYAVMPIPTENAPPLPSGVVMRRDDEEQDPEPDRVQGRDHRAHQRERPALAPVERGPEPTPARARFIANRRRFHRPASRSSLANCEPFAASRGPVRTRSPRGRSSVTDDTAALRRRGRRLTPQRRVIWEALLAEPHRAPERRGRRRARARTPAEREHLHRVSDAGDPRPRRAAAQDGSRRRPRVLRARGRASAPPRDLRALRQGHASSTTRRSATCAPASSRTRATGSASGRSASSGSARHACAPATDSFAARRSARRREPDRALEERPASAGARAASSRGRGPAARAPTTATMK